MQKKLVAEFFGTLVLAMGVLWSISSGLIFTPILAALILTAFVYSIGWLSGCHINPAVTLGLLSLKKIKTDEAVYFILTQLSAGLLAMMLATFFGLQLTSVASPTMEALTMEAFGMMVFTFGIGMVVAGKVKEEMNGVLVGVSLFVGIVLAVSGGAAGLLNPAVAVALKTSVIGYYAVEIIGGILGFQLAHFLAEKDHWWKK
jgi:aquaporin Z